MRILTSLTRRAGLAIRLPNGSSGKRIIHLVPLLGLVLLLLQGQAQAKDRRVALVIGNSAYRSAPVLTNPARDARSVAGMFREAGFDSVELKLDLDSLDMKRAVRGFLLTAKDSDLAVVFFAGHGIEVNGENYVIPVDAKLKTDFDVEDEGIALDRLIRAVEPARRLRLVILDACRDNPFINAMQRTVSLRAITAGLGKVEPEASDTLVAYAARAGSVADDGQAEHSPFTTALLRHLPTPGLDIRVAFGRVRDDVMRMTGGRQEPFVYGSLGGSTIGIVPDRAVAPPPAPSGESAAEARRDYEFAERVGTREAWTSFLKAHPAGFLADLARAQLTKFPNAATSPPRIDLSKRDVRQPATPAPPGTLASQPPRPPEPLSQVATASPPAASSPAASSLAANRSPCERDRETLARLRADPVAAEIARFARDVTCEELRPQIARLMESTGAADAVPAAAPLAPAPTAGRANAPAASCEQESRTLAQLRSALDLKAVDRFAREMACQDLKPQVLRLRESLQ